MYGLGLISEKGFMATQVATMVWLSSRVISCYTYTLLWIVGNMNPDLRERILEESLVWCQNLIRWLERCHSGNFLSGTHAEVSSQAEQLKEDQNYLDPTQTLPIPPLPPCQTHLEELTCLKIAINAMLCCSGTILTAML